MMTPVIVQNIKFKYQRCKSTKNKMAKPSIQPKLNLPISEVILMCLYFWNSIHECHVARSSVNVC